METLLLEPLLQNFRLIFGPTHVLQILLQRDLSFPLNIREPESVLISQRFLLDIKDISSSASSTSCDR